MVKQVMTTQETLLQLDKKTWIMSTKGNWVSIDTCTLYQHSYLNRYKVNTRLTLDRQSVDSWLDRVSTDSYVSIEAWWHVSEN